MGEKKVLVNFRVPESIYKRFSESVNKDTLEVSNTSAVTRLMDGYSNRIERQEKSK